MPAQRPLEGPEVAHLKYVLAQWSAGSTEKAALADGIIASAEQGALKATIVWKHDMPDMTASRFVVSRAAVAPVKSDEHAEVQRLYAQWKTDKLSPSAELSLINQCMDLHHDSQGADSPLTAEMVALGARGCQLTIQIYSSEKKLTVKMSAKDRTCILTGSTPPGGGFRLHVLAYLKLQIALQRLALACRGAGWSAEAAHPVFLVHGQDKKAVDYRQLTDADLRVMFEGGLLSHASPREDGEVKAIMDAFRFHGSAVKPRWEQLTREAASEIRQAMLTAAPPVPDAIAHLATTWTSGPSEKPKPVELQTYALKMAELLKPENLQGVPAHVQVQRAETAIKAYRDYLGASRSDPTLQVDQKKLEDFLARGGAARTILGGKFPDPDAEKAWNALHSPEAGAAEPSGATAKTS